MKILAFDTSTKFLTIACLDGEKVKSEFHVDAGIKHSEMLIPGIKSTLDRTGWDLKDVELIAVGIGPGSFTGLRIAIATAKGFAAVLGTKLIGVPTMDAMALNYKGHARHIAPFLNAHKNKIYTSVYAYLDGKIKRATDYLLVTADEFLTGLTENTTLFGDAIAIYKEKFEATPHAKYDEDVDWYPKAADIGRLGLKKAETSGTDSIESLTPLYLHAKECNITTIKNPKP